MVEFTIRVGHGVMLMLGSRGSNYRSQWAS